MKEQKFKKSGADLIIFVLVLLLFVFISGCASQPQPIPSPENKSQNTIPSLRPPATTCNDKDCFISAADKCEDTNITTNEDIGVIEYSSKDCVFTKTLVTLNENETQEMKKLLEGKSMKCVYEKGKFDSRLVTSLIYGTEYCLGDLKDNLGQLILFS